MTCDDALRKFGFVPALDVLDEVRRALEQEMKYRRREEPDDGDDHSDVLLVLCVQLFAARRVEDSPLIWRAKQNDFDASIYIDGELLCGAGLEATGQYLYQLNTKEAMDELEYILRQDWSNFTPEKHLDYFADYFRQSNVSS